MTTPAGADDVTRLLLTHADRAVTGPLEDPAVVAAVVGIERLVVATGSTDTGTLRAAVTGRPVPGAEVWINGKMVTTASRPSGCDKDEPAALVCPSIVPNIPAVQGRK